MKTAYLVTQGEYSDYCVIAVFSTREKAVAFIGHEPDGEYCAPTIEVRLLDPSRDGISVITVRMGEDGTVYSAKPSKVSDLPIETVDWVVPPVGHRRKGDALYCVVVTSSEKRAVKVANEKRTIIRALGLWGDDRGLDLVR